METHGQGQQGQQGEQRALWTARELEYFKTRLLDERNRVLAQLREFDVQLGTSQTELDGEITNWPFHLADEGTDTYEREQSSILATREGRLLWQIDEALRRLYRSPETFGRCDECGKKISFERLDAIPYVTRCVDCKQEWEGGRAD
jgi:RNA polymerase-binding transcription factor DksA